MSKEEFIVNYYSIDPLQLYLQGAVSLALLDLITPALLSASHEYSPPSWSNCVSWKFRKMGKNKSWYLPLDSEHLISLKLYDYIVHLHRSVGCYYWVLL